MARKLENPIGTGQPTASSPLSILDWDEGASQPPGWFGVDITYRSEQPAPQAEHSRPFLRVMIDLAEPTSTR